MIKVLSGKTSYRNLIREQIMMAVFLEQHPNPPTYPYVTGNGDTSGDKYQVSTKYEINNLKVKQSVAAEAVKSFPLA